MLRSSLDIGIDCTMKLNTCHVDDAIIVLKTVPDLHIFTPFHQSLEMIPMFFHITSTVSFL